MNNFGVIEIASTTTKTTPGWAYVPDTGPTPPAALQPTNRKRAARNQPALSLSDLSAREETRLRKDLEALDRDSNRDVNIPIPPRPGASSKAQSKHTPNVRKILQSQKTFANHLDDYHAMLALAESNPAAAAALNPAQAKPSTPSAGASKSASPAPTAAAAAASSGGGASKRSSAAAAKRAAAKEKQEQEKKKARQTAKPEPQPAADRSPDVEMPDAPPPPTTQAPPGREPAATDTAGGGGGGGGPAAEAAAARPSTYPRESAILPPYARPPPPPHPGDADPLVASRVPPFPSDDELRALMTAPPLSYLEARAAWDEDGPGRYPVRVFCAVCGYWGRVKCMKCGTRVCALDCLEAHREECVTRYGL
ncbi:uncharacterized protein P884DRAFT_291300 [Thermothelomyces heterothallicus CBS 202.75]|uniref:uncharacterized protein n=1 Tax=Thermothelomyces heterothallicus CBS 202.75 TaxID=1149848 RepID=UPI00374339FF